MGYSSMLAIMWRYELLPYDPSPSPPMGHPWCSVVVVEKKDEQVMLSYHDGKANIDLLAGEGN